MTSDDAGLEVRSVRFPTDMLAELDKVADDSDRSFSWAVRAACDAWLRSQQVMNIAGDHARRVWEGLTFPDQLRSLGVEVDHDEDPVAEEIVTSPGGLMVRIGGWDRVGFHVCDDEAEPIGPMLDLATASLDEAILLRAHRMADVAGGIAGMKLRHRGLAVKEWTEQGGWYRHLQGRLDLMISVPVKQENASNTAITEAIEAIRDLPGAVSDSGHVEPITVPKPPDPH